MNDQRQCVCEDWAQQIPRINGPIELQQIRAGLTVPADYFKAWNYCPWCGRSVAPTPTDQPAF